jgi:SPX domain protein involved in polyphosphate accumulation
MKFGKRLVNSLIPEWKDKYINYKFLKDQIKLINRDRDRLVKMAVESGNVLHLRSLY